MMVSFTDDVPTGWVSTRLGDLYSFEYGKSLTKGSRASAGKYPVYGSSGIVGMHDQYLIEGPTIIVGRKGAAGSVNYSTDNLWPIDTTYYVRDDKNLCLKFSYYLFRSLNLAKLEASTAIPGLNRNHAYDETVLLPPLPEQHRIVAKIEELFSELDKGIENLKTARAQLKVYRQALLKHAFEGKLTAQWRAENQGKLETADALLKRIQQERAQRYQQQIKSPSLPLLQRGKTTSAATSSHLSLSLAHPPLKKGGRGDLKPKAPKPLPPLTAEELAELPELPEGWGWVRLGDLLSVSSGSGLTSSQMKDGSFPVYGGNGISGFHDKYLFENETLILGRVGAKCGVVHITRPKSWITDNALIVDFLIYSLDLRYMKLRLEYLDLNKHSVSTAQPVISGSKIYPLFIGLPCLQEQIEIANQIEFRLSEVDQLDQTLTTSLQQAEALRQSILKKAFSGQLVAQDPHDEPASALLARIQAERANIVAKSSKKSRGT